MRRLSPPSQERRFVDSNVFLYVLMADPRYGSRAKEHLKETGLVTSTLALSQVLAHLDRRRAWSVIPTFLAFLRDKPVEVIEARLEDFEEAVREAERLGLSLRMWDDLVLAVQMRRVGVEEVLSNDRDFDLIPWVRRVF